ncbi:type II secretion system F family protein [bacterium]|nr:type II secretion system F family protein [bacterium]
MLFDYKAKTEYGKTVKGSIDAPNEEMAIDSLTEQGLILLSLVERKKQISLKKQISFSLGVKEKDLVLFYRQMSVMISSGVSIVEALETMIEQTSNPKLKSIISEIVDDVRGGTSLSAAMAKHRIFSNFCLNMIRSGETTGRIDEVFKYLADEEEKNYDLISKIKGAMVYPTFVLVAAGGVITLLMTFVFPKLAAVLKEYGAELPLTTRIVMAISNFMVNWWILIILVLIGLYFLIRYGLKTKIGTFIWDIVKLKLPVFNNLFKNIYLVRFCRSLSTLIVAGVPLVSALEISSNVVGNVVYKKLIAKTIKAVEEGKTISSVFAESKLIPKMLTNIIAIGEKTGKLDEVLDKMANFYARIVEDTLGKLTVLIEPIVIILLGGVVALVFASVLLPMYNMASTIR